MPLIRYAKAQQKTVIISAEILAIQVVEPFVLYTVFAQVPHCLKKRRLMPEADY